MVTLRSAANIVFAIAALAAYATEADPALVALFLLFGWLLMWWNLDAWQEAEEARDE